MNKYVLSSIGLVLILIMTVLFVRTFSLPSRQLRVEPVAKLPLNIDAAARRLAGALSIPSVSHQDNALNDPSQLLKLHQYLASNYPLVHSNLELQPINRYSLLYTWKGSALQLPPLLLMAHLDVVPAEPETRSQWKYDPFNGVYDGNIIWGRGALDDKGTVISILEAVEWLLKDNFTPERTVIIAFGHDEELGGNEGASHIAEHLRLRQIHPAFILDEGGAIVSGIMPGMEQPVALVALGEKGYVSLELTAQGTGGHSSMPPPQTAIGILSAGIQKLETNPFPSEITGPVKELLLTLAPEMDLPKRLVMANLWLFSGVVKNMMAANSSSNALIRTTTAVTMVEGGVKDNVLPPIAKATVNFRIRPGDSIADIVDHVKTSIADSRITVSVLQVGFNREASPLSSSRALYYQQLARTIRQVFPDVVVAPGLSVGGTDTKHYTDLTDNIYRFIPFRLTKTDLKRIHGANERVSLKELAEAVTFYTYLIRETTKE